MSDTTKRLEQTPDNYSPKTSEIVNLAKAATDVKINGEIVPFLFKKEIVHLSKSLLIGKKVTYPTSKQGQPVEEGGNPPLNLLWEKCNNDGTFIYLQNRKESMNLEAHLGFYYDINKNGDGMFSYIVGSLMKTDIIIPEGFDCLEVPESDIAICWFIYKDDDDIWSVAHSTVAKYMEEQGYEGTGGCSELYAFTDEAYKEETGYNILGYFIVGKK